MLAIYKRELQSYFNSVIGYLVMAVMLLFIGIYYIFINLTYGYSSFSASLYSVSFIFVIVIPILTMRSLSEDRKNKTDQLLLTSPVSVSGIVIGKYLAMVSVFGLVCLISCIFPLLLKSLGSTKMLASYSMILAFFLFGCAAIAIGMFISSLTENQILACVGTVGVMLILELMDSISSLIPETSTGSFAGLILVVIIAAYLITNITKNWIIGCTGGVIGCGILTVLYVVKSSLFENLLPGFLNSLSLSARLDNFYNEVFDVSAIVFYLSVMFVFLFLTVQTIETMFRTNSFHHGSYSVLLSCIVIALAIIVNLVVSALPSSMINLDLSSNKILSISDQSKDIVKKLEQDVTIYALFEENNQDETLMQLLDRYKELSDHIKVEVVDPISNPAFAANYDASSLSTGSLIVESEDRYKTIDYSEIYESSYYNDSSSYYGYSTTTEFDGEGEITSAIDYVTSEELPVLYYTTGHDETTLGDSTTSALTKSNYDVQSLSLMSEGSIPEDCGVLMILAPQADFSSDEADMVIEYLENGGKALILTSYTGETLTEFERILDNYGLGTSQGIIFEGDSSSYYQNPMYIIPQYGSHDITADASDSNTLALIIQAAALEQKEVRSSVTQTPLLTTSESAYEKIPENGQFATTEKESGDKEGSFNLGILAEETVSDEETTQLIVFSTPYLTEESFVSNYNISNVDIFLNSIGYMCEHENSISIDAKSMDIETITPSAATVSMQSILFVVLLPAGLLITGIVVWLRRRKK